jgi:CHAD domain-containing protein
MRDEQPGASDQVPADMGTPDIAQVLIDSLTQRWRKYLKELRRCKRQFSEESVHDLRVATRRLISTLAIMEIVNPDLRSRRLQRRLKKLFDAFGPLRDTQVQILTLGNRVSQYPELATLLTMLRVRERNQMNQVAGKIMKLETLVLSRTISGLKRSLQEHFSNPTLQAIGMNAVLGAAASKYMTAVAGRERVIPSRGRTIHRARIAFKKLRYTMEALLPLLPLITKEQMKAMDNYQTRMGNIQDAEVMGAMVRNFAARRPLASRRRLSGFRRQMSLNKKELTAAYMQSADELYTFWKPQSR